MGGQEGHGVLGRTVKESGTGRSISQGGNSQSIIRLASDLHACTGYKGNYMKRTKDRLANETTRVRMV